MQCKEKELAFEISSSLLYWWKVFVLFSRKGAREQRRQVFFLSVFACISLRLCVKRCFPKGCGNFSFNHYPPYYRYRTTKYKWSQTYFSNNPSFFHLTKILMVESDNLGCLIGINPFSFGFFCMLVSIVSMSAFTAV